MTQGIYVRDPESARARRPKSKKEIREIMAISPAYVHAEATANVFHPEAREFDGSFDQAPVGTKVVFVGPDPYTKRNFYGTITVTANGIKVT